MAATFISVKNLSDMKISENSTVTIGLAISLLGASGFITNIYFKAEANAEAQEKFEQSVTTKFKEIKADYKEDTLEIKSDIKEIKQDLKQLLKRR